MIWSWVFRALGGVAVVWMLFLLGSAPAIGLEVESLDLPIPATVHCDAVLQSGDATAVIGRDGEVLTPRWQVDGGDRSAIEARLRDAADPVADPSGGGSSGPDVVLDESAISASCDARRSYRIGWSILLLGLAVALFRAGRVVAEARAAAPVDPVKDVDRR